MRIVIDTNVIASGIFFSGKPGILLEKVVSKELDAFVSESIFLEYQETLEELCSKYPSKPPRLPLSNLLAAMKMIQPHSCVRVCRDPDDDKFIECALDAQCIYIVSGDHDLLSVRQYKGIRIVSVAEFLAE